MKITFKDLKEVEMFRAERIQPLLLLAGVMAVHPHLVKSAEACGQLAEELLSYCVEFEIHAAAASGVAAAIQACAVERKMEKPRTEIAAGDVRAVLVERKRGTATLVFGQAFRRRCTCGGIEPPCDVCMAREAVLT